MTVPAAKPRNDYVGTGLVDNYDYNFRILDAADLLVTVADIEGNETTLALTTDYTVTGVGSYSGGTITLVAGFLADGYALTIRRRVTIRQLTDLRNQGGYYPETVEDMVDLITQVAQQLDDEMLRTIKQPETEVGDGSLVIPTLANRANRYLYFDANGKPTAAIQTDVNTTVTAFMATLLDDVDATTALATLGLTVSAFGKTLIDDANDSAARTTLKIQKHLVYNYIATGTANAITLNIPDGLPVQSGFDHEFGTFLIVYAQHTNTSTTVTLNLNSIGAQSVKVAGGGNPAIGAIQEDQVHFFYWDNLGNYWVLVNPYSLNSNITLHRKVIDIGDWNMDANSFVQVAHGLTDHTAVRSISVTVRDDTETGLHNLFSDDGTGTGNHRIGIDATNVSLLRPTGGYFDVPSFSATSYNRGWIIIDYV